MANKDDALKTLVKEPKVPEEFAYNICMRYELSWSVQTAIETLISQLFKLHGVPMLKSAEMISAIFYRQHMDKKKVVVEE